MILHIVRIVGLIPLIVLCTFYPFLPGEYDPLAMSLSAMAQTLGLAGLLGVPVGIAWPIFELAETESFVILSRLASFRAQLSI